MFLRSKPAKLYDCSHADLVAMPFRHVLQYDELEEDSSLQQLKMLQRQVELCLSLAHKALALNSIVLLVPEPLGLRYYVYASCSKDRLLAGAVDSGAGIFGCFKHQDRVIVAPYKATSPALAYYQKAPEISSFMGVMVPLAALDTSLILCLDRLHARPWSDNELAIVDTVRSQLDNIFEVYSHNMRLRLERNVFQRAFNGLRGLNTALALSDVYRAITQTIKTSMHIDFCAIASIQGASARVESWSGSFAEAEVPGEIAIEDSVFAQVLKYQRPFPESGELQATLLTGKALKFFKQFRSFLVLPCLQPEATVTHALIIASYGGNDLTNRYRNLFDLISDQLAIKLDLARSHEQIRNMALQDALTGIANLRSFNSALNTMYERAMRSSGHLSLVACDIDHFKNINDRYGHPCGDFVIKQVAQTLNDEIRAIDIVARTGGEEFLILLEGVGQKKAVEIAERIRARVETLRIFWQKTPLQISISMGIATLADAGHDKELLVARADQALYLAKDSGRNRVCLWSQLT